MIQSQDLIKNLTHRENEKDLCVSTDSGSEQMISSEQDEENNSNLNALKRGDGVVWRKIENKLGLCMSQIE